MVELLGVPALQHHHRHHHNYHGLTGFTGGVLEGEAMRAAEVLAVQTERSTKSGVPLAMLGGAGQPLQQHP